MRSFDLSYQGNIFLYKRSMHPFLIIMPDLSGRISIHSANVGLFVRVDIAFSVDASLRSSI